MTTVTTDTTSERLTFEERETLRRAQSLLRRYAATAFATYGPDSAEATRVADELRTLGLGPPPPAVENRAEETLRLQREIHRLVRNIAAAVEADVHPRKPVDGGPG